MIGAALSTLSSQLLRIEKLLELATHRAAALSELELSEASGSLKRLRFWADEMGRFPFHRSFESAMIVVLLYGALERFIEDLAFEYLEEYTIRLKSKEGMPSKILDTHFEVTLEHLKLSNATHYRGVATKIDLARSLHAMLSSGDISNFVIEPFIRHTTNFRISAIDDFFSRIAVPQICRLSAMEKEAIDYAKTIGFAPMNGQYERLWSDIDDLVEERNKVAHGDLSNFQSTPVLMGYRRIIEVFGRCLTRLVRDKLCEHLYARIAQKIGSPIAIFGKGVVCLNTNGVRLKIDDLLCCVNAEGFSHSLKIIEIQAGGISISETVGGNNIDVGLRVDGSCRKNHVIHVLTSEER